MIFFGWMAGVAAGQASSGAGTLADAFVHAWNAHDGRAFGRLYADDADWVTVGGERHKGRIAVEGALAKEHAIWARTTTLHVALALASHAARFGFQIAFYRCRERCVWRMTWLGVRDGIRNWLRHRCVRLAA